MHENSEFINLLNLHSGNPYKKKKYEENSVLSTILRKIRWKITSIFDDKNGFQPNFTEKQWNLINSSHYVEKKRIAVYTTILGDYDYLKIPLVQQDNIDFYVFTDGNIKCDEYLNVIDLKAILSLNYSDVLINRYLKMHPFEFFSNYDYSLYIDSNVWISGNLNILIDSVKNFENNVGVFMHIHSNRNCLYNEARVLKIIKKGNKKQISKQIASYRNSDFPRDYGLLEATVILTQINSKKARIILTKWWEDFLLRKSYRDQLSLPFVLWKLGIDIKDVGVLGSNVKKNPFFVIEDH